MARAAKKAKGLTEKQERFAVAYFKLGNASEAYRVAYSVTRMKAKQINSEASKLLKHPGIARRVADLRGQVSDRAVLTVEKTLAELARIVYCDPAAFVDEHGNLIPLKDLPVDVRAALASFESFEEYDGRGEDRQATGMVRKIKLWDKGAALSLAMRHLGLFEKDNKQKVDPLTLLMQWVNERNAVAGTLGLPIKA